MNTFFPDMFDAATQPRQQRGRPSQNTLHTLRRALAAIVCSCATVLALTTSCAHAQMASDPGKIEAIEALVIGYADYPPDHYTDATGQPVGWAVDLLTQAAATLGVPVQLTLVGSFQSLLPGVNAKKYHLAMGAFSITEARKQQYDFVSYFNSGNSIVIRSGRAPVTVDSMCGKRAAIVLGSYFAKIVEDFSAACIQQNNPAITLMTFPTQEAVLIALDSGRADFSVSSLSASNYLSKQTKGRYTVSGDPFFRTVAGLAFDKSEAAIRDAVAAALQTLVASGRYREILTQWGVEDGAVERIEINP